MTEELGALAELLEKKNYFVVSVAVNSEIADIPWRNGRLVMPCGSDRLVQCDASCENGVRRFCGECAVRVLTDWGSVPSAERRWS